MEEEIKALKEKLRTTDDELQKFKEKEEQMLNKHLKAREMGDESACDMCSNYEAQLQRIQMEVKDLKKQLQESEQMLLSQNQDLVKEVEFRKGMEERWNEKKEEHKSEVTNLTSSVKIARQTIDELKQQYSSTKESVTKELCRLTREREEVQRHLDE